MWLGLRLVVQLKLEVQKEEVVMLGINHGSSFEEPLDPVQT